MMMKWNGLNGIGLDIGNETDVLKEIYAGVKWANNMTYEPYLNYTTDDSITRTLLSPPSLIRFRPCGGRKHFLPLMLHLSFLPIKPFYLSVPLLHPPFPLSVLAIPSHFSCFRFATDESTLSHTPSSFFFQNEKQHLMSYKKPAKKHLMEIVFFCNSH